MTRPEADWFHGTRRGFRGGGGLLVPRSVHGSTPTGAPVNVGREALSDASQWVYLTRNLDLAWVYAWHASGRGKPKVLRVQPHGVIELDPEHSARMDAWRCEWATVQHVLTSPTVTEADARAGWVH